MFINQGCTFLDYSGIRIGERVMIGPKVTDMWNDVNNEIPAAD